MDLVGQYLFLLICFPECHITFTELPSFCLATFLYIENFGCNLECDDGAKKGFYCSTKCIDISCNSTLIYVSLYSLIPCICSVLKFPLTFMESVVRQDLIITFILWLFLLLFILGL
ncbi:hypothetical protein RJT34_17149 [Clitoria ternatea]|uniref:Uncharacterized protein n=1 Tax=Clitoria ternatea TaxID=43366 RepID=A0AAN9J8P6_CLITE